MSNERNVHHDFYEVAGRERPGREIVQEEQRAKSVRSRERETRVGGTFGRQGRGRDPMPRTWAAALALGVAAVLASASASAKDPGKGATVRGSTAKDASKGAAAKDSAKGAAGGGSAKAAAKSARAAKGAPGTQFDAKATAYSVEGKTADGTHAREGVVAADPDVLPLGSRIRIDGAGPYSGEYVVEDTGPAVQGGEIDLYLPNDREAKRFGRKEVRVEVLERGEGRDGVPERVPGPVGR